MNYFFAIVLSVSMAVKSNSQERIVLNPISEFYEKGLQVLPFNNNFLIVQQEGSTELKQNAKIRSTYEAVILTRKIMKQNLDSILHLIEIKKSNQIKDTIYVVCVKEIWIKNYDCSMFIKNKKYGFFNAKFSIVKLPSSSFLPINDGQIYYYSTQ